MVNDRAVIGPSRLRAHNIMKLRVNEQETCGTVATCSNHH